jgi:hypothetical protein
LGFQPGIERFEERQQEVEHVGQEEDGNRFEVGAAPAFHVRPAQAARHLGNQPDGAPHFAIQRGKGVEDVFQVVPHRQVPRLDHFLAALVAVPARKRVAAGFASLLPGVRLFPGGRLLLQDHGRGAFLTKINESSGIFQTGFD